MNAENNELIPMGTPSSGFDVVMRGYDRSQVLDAISRLEDDMRTIVAERDRAVAAATALHHEVEELTAEQAELKDQLSHQAPTFESMGGRIASMLKLAEEEAADIRRSAEAEAEAIRAEAEDARAAAEAKMTSDRAEADQYAADRTAEADKTLADAKAEAAEHLDSHRRQAEEHLTTARTQAATLQRESEAKRKEADEDFELTLAARRTAAQAEETERDRTSREDAANRIQQAKDDSDAMLSAAHRDATSTIEAANQKSTALVAAAQQEVNHLQQLRSTLAEQIRSIGELVAGVPAALATPPEALLADREIDAPHATLPAQPQLYAGTGGASSASTESGEQSDPVAESGEQPVITGEAPADVDGLEAPLVEDEPQLDVDSPVIDGADDEPAPEASYDAPGTMDDEPEPTVDVNLAAVRGSVPEPPSNGSPVGLGAMDDDEEPVEAERTVQISAVHSRHRR